MRSLWSPSWYRVRELRPRLRSQAEIHRNVFRGEVWYVVEDHATGAFQRISEAAYRLVGLMDGRRTVEEIWLAASERLGDVLPTQDETIQLLVRLHHADLLHADIPPDLAQVVERGRKTERRKRAASLRNPLAIRVPLFDPDRFIAATLWLVRPLFSWFGVLLWLGVVGVGIALAVTHWQALSSNIADRALSTSNILLLVAIYPAVKALHELGHAYAVRRWGGEVHEIGIMLLVFMPVPYVDASASSAFRSKWRRAAVAAAGILVELFLAGLAMIVWTALEPGMLRAAMMNVMLLAGLSTLLFNGNPLLRFDGYYVLADLVEVPNLGSRSNQHLLHLVQRYLFGLEDLTSPAMARGEAAWFTCYGIAALAYRLFIMAAIILFVAGQFFEVGLVLAAWTLALLLVVPAFKALRFVLTSPRLEDRRGRGLAAAVALGAAAGWLLFAQPAPQRTLVQGVVWAPDETLAKAGADGFVAELLARPGERVQPGQPILRIEEPLLDMRVRLLEARRQELELRRQRSISDPVAADLATEELRLAEEELALARERRGEQLLAASRDGQLLLPDSEGLVGRFVRKGETLAWVVRPEDTLIRAAVDQDDIDLVRRRLVGVEVRLASAAAEVGPADVAVFDPAATDRLPSRALSTAGGGPFTLDPTGDGERSLERVFLIDLRPRAPIPEPAIGERAYVRFDHGSAPLSSQLWRRMRQIFLRDLNL